MHGVFTSDVHLCLTVGLWLTLGEARGHREDTLEK